MEVWSGILTGKDLVAYWYFKHLHDLHSSFSVLLTTTVDYKVLRKLQKKDANWNVSAFSFCLLSYSCVFIPSNCRKI